MVVVVVVVCVCVCVCVGGDTSMAQAAYKSRTPGLILGFRGFKSS